MHLNFERIPILGGAIFIASLLPAVFLCTQTDSFLDQIPYKKAVALNKAPLQSDFNFSLSNTLSVLSKNSDATQITFSLDPPRPSSTADRSRILIRLAQAKQSKRVNLPASVGLEFGADQSLQFREQDDPFWLECNLTPSGQVAAALYLITPAGEKVCKENWISSPQETPLLSVDEIAKASPFKALAESRWWGQDLFAEKFDGSGQKLHRIEMGGEANPTLLEFQTDQWLVFKENRWQQAPMDETCPIAHVKANSSQGLEIEGWEGSSHIRFKIPQILSIPLKTKGEELFSQLRIRSEKQVSCMIDKQCLILRMGDWVLKTPNRWKVLRKKEEKEAFLTGNITGDLFVLDRIDAKGTTKSIGGQLFSIKRSQVASIECVQPIKSAQGSTSLKGAGKSR